MFARLDTCNGATEDNKIQFDGYKGCISQSNKAINFADMTKSFDAIDTDDEAWISEVEWKNYWYHDASTCQEQWSGSWHADQDCCARANTVGELDNAKCKDNFIYHQSNNECWDIGSNTYFAYSCTDPKYSAPADHDASKCEEKYYSWGWKWKSDNDCCARENRARCGDDYAFYMDLSASCGYNVYKYTCSQPFSSSDVAPSPSQTSSAVSVGAVVACVVAAVGAGIGIGYFAKNRAAAAKKDEYLAMQARLGDDYTGL
jgi:hypothetical protein